MFTRRLITRTSAVRLSTALLGMCIASTASLQAQGAPASTTDRSDTRGMLLGVHLNGSALGFEKNDNVSGGGAGIRVGYGFNSKFLLYVGVDAAKVEIKDEEEIGLTGDYTLSHVDIGARYSFSSPTRAWVPYLNAAATGRGASATLEGLDISITGPAFTVGGGVQYFFNRKVALDIGLEYSGGKFNKIKVAGISLPVDDADTSASSRLNIGVSFYPHIGH